MLSECFLQPRFGLEFGSDLQLPVGTGFIETHDQKRARCFVQDFYVVIENIGG